MTTIATPRLLLRPWRDEDLVPFAALNADPRVMEHYLSALTQSESDALAARIRARLDQSGQGLWAVEVPGSTGFIGYVGLAQPSYQARFTPCTEIGWRLAHEFWGHGYASEAAAAVLAHGFNVLGLDEILAFTVPANQRSWRLMERIGMKRSPEEDFEHPNIPEGHRLRTHVLYRLSKPDWLGIVA